MNCPNCSEYINNPDSFCSNCGEKIDSDKEEDKQSDNKDNSQRMSYIGFIIIFILLIFGLVFSSAIFLTGLEDLQNKDNTNNSSNNTDLYSEWNTSDNYPSISRVNYKYDTHLYNNISDYGIDRWSDENHIETSAGIYPHHLPNDTIEYLNNVYLFNISSNDYFNLYVIEGNTTKIYSDLLENPSSLYSYDTIDKYTKFRIKEYNETIRINNKNYLVVYAVPGELPNGSFEDQYKYSDKNIKISGKVEKAGYIPYDEYKSKRQARFMMKENTIFDE